MWNKLKLLYENPVHSLSSTLNTKRLNAGMHETGMHSYKNFGLASVPFADVAERTLWRARRYLIN